MWSQYIESIVFEGVIGGLKNYWGERTEVLLGEETHGLDLSPMRMDLNEAIETSSQLFWRNKEKNCG